MEIHEFQVQWEFLSTHGNQHNKLSQFSLFGPVDNIHSVTICEMLLL